jgi:hypothetical protein
MAIIDVLSHYNIHSQTKNGAPGVYVADAKIAAIGLKVKNGRTYHGLSLNVDMDLSPFSHINPCGYQDLALTQLADLTDNIKIETIASELTQTSKKYVTRIIKVAVPWLKHSPRLGHCASSQTVNSFSARNVFISLSTFEPVGCLMRIQLGFLSGVRVTSDLIFRRAVFDSPFKALISTSCNIFF